MKNPLDKEAVKVLATNVKKYRKEKKLSQRELADLCQIEISTISRIELGKINSTVSTIFLIAKVLEIEPYKLLINILA